MGSVVLNGHGERMRLPIANNSDRYFTRSYIFIRHILCVFLGASCMIWVFAFCYFVFLVLIPCWTHLFERAKIMSWLVRIALYASLKFLWGMELLWCFTYIFWAWCALVLLKKCSHASLRFIWELVIFFKKFSLAPLKLFWEKQIWCSWSSLIFVWAY